MVRRILAGEGSPNVYDQHPHLIRLLTQERYVDVDRNATAAEAVRTIRQARRTARRHSITEFAARLVRIRSQVDTQRLNRPATTPATSSRSARAEHQWSQ
jgi:hypothetical protein